MVLLAVALMLQGSPQPKDVCPMRIELTRGGAIFTNRFHGRHRTSMELLADDLHGGCYNDARPNEVTSVSLQIDQGASQRHVDDLYSALAKCGWPKERLVMKTWWPR
jgi:hypothetical protein